VLYYLFEFFSSFGWMAQHTPWHRLSIKVDDVGSDKWHKEEDWKCIYIFVW